MLYKCICMLKWKAKENEVYLIGGSIPEKDGDKLYNTCPIFDPNGNLIAKHRKVYACLLLRVIDYIFEIKYKKGSSLWHRHSRQDYV